MLSKVYYLAITASFLIASFPEALTTPAINYLPLERYSVSSQSTPASTTASLPCYNFADPDNGVGDYCRCFNGASTSVAASTGTNTGSNYNPCPYTKAPSAPTITSAPHPRSINLNSSTNTATAGNATTTSYSQLPCYNFADPDEGVGDFCICSNGISTPIAQATGTNTGSNYNPCPFTVAPTVQVTSISTPSSPAEATSATTTAAASCTDDAVTGV